MFRGLAPNRTRDTSQAYRPPNSFVCSLLIGFLGGRFGYFLFFLLGGGEGEFEVPGGGRGRFFFFFQEGGVLPGEGRGGAGRGWEGVCGEFFLGGGG